MIRLPQVTAPYVNVDAVLDEDRRTGRVLPRIGIKQEVNFTSKDGQLIQRDDYAIWSMAIYSEDAKSMSIKFDDTHLPENAIMFLYNEDSKFVVGPIGNNNFKNGSLKSDYLNGDHIVIGILLPRISIEDNFYVKIYNDDYGVIALNEIDGDFNTSDNCNINTACKEGKGWECQINAVCKIIHPDIGSCSGTLINNDCCDLSPFILTANHCVTNNIDEYVSFPTIRTV